MEETIKKIFKNDEIRIKKLGNSYSSNVYLITLNNKKYIFKVLKLEEKRKVEKNTLRYLKKHIKVPELVKSGVYKDIYYNIIEFVEGKSYLDKESKLLTDEELIKMGSILSKFHALKPMDNTDFWINYIKFRLESAYKKLSSLENNEKIYLSLLKELKSDIENNYEKCMLHMDFRPGNIIINDDMYLIDFESVKNGDPAFDFIKIKRLLTKRQFNKFLEGYRLNKELPFNFENKIDFYNIFDAYTALDWCIMNNQEESDYYKLNMKEIKKYENRKFQ